MSLPDVSPADLHKLPPAQFEELLSKVVSISQEDRKQNQLRLYRPASPKALSFHESSKKVVAAGGGNGSAKTETMLAEVVMCATGVFPYSLEHLAAQKFLGPIKCRVTVESLTTTLEPIILPKLQWWKWTGVDAQGGARGHWGWIPRNCLVDGDWQRSYSSKLRLLTVLCRDPENPDRVLGESTIQFMSVDMDPSDFASGDFQICAHDEPPSLPIWRENEARTMRVNGRMLLAMTWPDDPSIAVDWLYDEVYEPGKQGSSDVDWIELWTTENPHLRQDAVAAQAEKWSAEIANVRIYGRPIRFSNRVHAEFTDSPKTWCFDCGKSVVGVVEDGKQACGACGSQRVTTYCHVEEFEASEIWPTVFVIDPHPRKPHVMAWFQITPSDDWRVVAECESDGDCVDTKKATDRVEQSLRLTVAQRLMDPNMGASPSGQRREVSWQDEFAGAGLPCELASDIDVGRGRINTMLRPDPDTLRPRMVFHPRCRNAIHQFNRFSWADFSKSVDRDQKQVPKDKYSDYPACGRYFANSDPVFRFLKSGAPVAGSRAYAGRRHG